MNVSTIKIDKHEALQKLRDYRFLNKSQKTREDERLEALYKAVSNGARVIDVNKAFKATGLSDKGHPRLAIARADTKVCWFHPRRNENKWGTPRGGGGFSDWGDWRWNYTAKNYVVPGGTFDDKALTQYALRTRVPHIPPKLRPQIALRNFHILFEVQKWDEYPVDPFLLRKIDGGLFVVLAEWELTELEAALLSAMTGN
jgi:hypothetical protein